MAASLKSKQSATLGSDPSILSTQLSTREIEVQMDFIPSSQVASKPKG